MASPNSSWRLNIQDQKEFQIQAPQYRQYALISYFLDLVKLSIQEEPVLATNWITDRPEGMKLQNLALATMTGPALRSLLENITANVPYATNKCESLGSGKIDPSREFIGTCKGFFPDMAVLRRHFLPSMHFQCCMLLQDTLPRCPRLGRLIFQQDRAALYSKLHRSTSSAHQTHCSCLGSSSM